MTLAVVYRFSFFRLWVAREPRVALDRAGMTVFRDIAFLAAGPASERRRSAAWWEKVNGRGVRAERSA